MFTPSMVMPPAAWIGAPAASARMIFGDLLPVSPLALALIALAAVGCGCLLVALVATRRREERRTEGRVRNAPEGRPRHRHAA